MSKEQAKPYRSEVRDRPRVLTPLTKSTNEEKFDRAIKGKLNYWIKGPPFLEIFENGLSHNQSAILEEFSESVGRLENTLNWQYELAAQYMWAQNMPYSVVSPVTDVLNPCFHKSLIGLSTAFFLTKHGLWGPARPLIRHAFESLIIAKFCSVDNQSVVFDKWVDGIDLYFTNSVLKKLKKPDVFEFKRFWSLMSDYSHSSVYASQPDVCVDDHQEQVGFNLLLIEMMLECKYHLLISHIVTPSMQYHLAYYKDKSRATELKKLLRQNHSASKAEMAAGARQLIRNYRSTWAVMA